MLSFKGFVEIKPSNRSTSSIPFLSILAITLPSSFSSDDIRNDLTHTNYINPPTSLKQTATFASQFTALSPYLCHLCDLIGRVKSWTLVTDQG